MNLEEIVGERFGRYSKYIIQDRALPDVRDGLKPVQRRILFAMNELGMGSTKAFKKSARIVGEVIGKYHPHGDSSVYEAMVRMSQDWKMRNRLIEMHGNNGSIDNDPAAAMRYTEARLTVFSEALLQDIDKKTVNFIPNFDDYELEPVVLPAKFPNLLVNGGTGMATGYATNIPPHNLNEVLEAIIYKIEHKDCSLADLMKFIKGPDFPTGGIVEGRDEIEKAFKTGKGKIVIRSKVEVNETELIVTEIPYEVNKAELVRKISEIALKKKIDGIVEVNDISDREGIRIEIKLKKDIASDVILAYLLKNTDLSKNYNYNMVAISQRSPRLLSLDEILNEYILHQKEVIRNRSNYELQRLEKRKHIVLGFLKMVSVLDEVIRIIRQSSGKKDAETNLIERFSFTSEQADAIVSLRLYRLSSTDVSEMENESVQLSKEIKKLIKILNNEHDLENVIISEIKELMDKYPSPRLSVIKDEIKKIEIDEQELIENENVMVVISRDGYIKRSSLKSYQATQGATGLKENDVVLKKGEVNTRSTLLLFTNLGNFIQLPVHKIMDAKWKDMGDYIGNFAALDNKEKVIDYIVVDEFDEERFVLVANQDGSIKRVLLSDFNKTRINKTFNVLASSTINPLVSIDLQEAYDTYVVMVSKNGYVVKYDIEEIPVQSLMAKGVKGINLRKDKLVGAKFATKINKDEILMLTNRGGLKREFTANIDVSHRPAKGKRYFKLIKSNPYEVVSIASENIFRLKSFITLHVIGKVKDLVIQGEEIKPDRYENGIPTLEKEDQPQMLRIDIDRYNESNDLLLSLAEQVEDEDDQNSEDVISELEKIISISKDSDPEDIEEDEDDDENIIQQKLF
ncbi:DNA topoisomerase IV subunit A [Hujiaoplasma nucleasis]|uniref:DNA topoisomerase (ATP-hydrolyzing) n=2 Tax=Hujiaoplasma nucleasis TaxID=2725268 RepID=A0A7L6N8R1_9MOLU|nr:DNA topoisomerase IV subunit A [Hujiaoplasma nucleasis]